MFSTCNHWSQVSLSPVSIKVKQEVAFEEHYVMLRPMCGVEQGTLNAGSGQATYRSHGMDFIELQQLEMKSANKDPR